MRGPSGRPPPVTELELKQRPPRSALGGGLSVCPKAGVRQGFTYSRSF
jgi:hypothetical protein